MRNKKPVAQVFCSLNPRTRESRASVPFRYAGSKLAACVALVVVSFCLSSSTIAQSPETECDSTSQCQQQASPVTPSNDWSGELTALTPDQVWSPIVEELDWSEVRPSSLDQRWLNQATATESNEQIVVRGVADGNSAIDIAAAKHVMPALEREMPLEAPWDRHFAMQRILAELNDPDSPMIVDSVSQTFFRSVGDEQISAFTREALLLNLSDENLHELRRDVSHAVHRNHRVLTETVSIVLVAFAVTIVVCWLGSRFLDRVTQGYYVWPIRFATSLVLLGSVAVTARFAFLVLKSLG